MYSANCNDSVSETTRAWAEIDLGALKHNFEYAKKRSDRRVICVLKADAYGHGAVKCGQFLQRNGAEMFAVAALSEAVELRENGITIPILILGYTAPEYAEILSRLNIEQTVVDEAHAAALNRAAGRLGVKVMVHIALDTGMSRIGIFAQSNHSEAVEAAERIYHMSECIRILPLRTTLRKRLSPIFNTTIILPFLTDLPRTVSESKTAM